MSGPGPAWAAPYIEELGGLSAPGEGKRGRAELVFERDTAGRTFLSRQYVEYPFHVTRPFYVDEEWPELATLYLQSVSGGLFQGDRLSLRLRMGEGAAAHVTSQSATKVHSMEQGAAYQLFELEVLSGGYLEYLPDPLILFPRARLASTVSLVCAEGATAVLSDSFLSHDPAGGSLPAFDFFGSETAIRRPGGELIALDRFCIEHPGEESGNPALAGGYAAQGAIYVVGDRHPADELAEGLRRALAQAPEAYGGASTLPGGAGAWMRVLAPDGGVLRSALQGGCAAARELAAGRPFVLRRK